MIKEAIPVRASSIGELFDCPARWEAKYIKGLYLPASPYARLGTAVHAGTAAFDQAALSGNPITPNEAAGACVDSIFSRGEDTDWSEIKPLDCEKIAIPLTEMYCEKIAPKQEYIAVEATCENLTFTDIGITLTGTVDRVRKTDQGLGIADLKTGKTAVAADGTVKTQGHALQMGVYEILAQSALGRPMDAPAQIIGLQTGKTDKGRRVGTGEIACASSALLDGEEGEPGYLRMAAGLLHGGNFYGNPRSSLCSEKYCPAYKICRWRK